VADSTTAIQFREFGIGEIFQTYQIQVPPNQRDYAWKREQVTTLCSDFDAAMSDDGPYFVGTIVTIDRGQDVLEVVDGQQRLATVAILIAAIRDYLREQGDSEAVKSIEGDYLARFNLAKRDSIHKMALNVADNELFHRVIDGTDVPTTATRQSHKRLLDARVSTRKHVRQVLSSLVNPASHPDRLVEWIEFIRKRAQVVLLQVSTDADAYRMFETLNDRGLRVSQADLVKNHLFARAGNDRMVQVQHLWSGMTSTLEAATNDPDVTIDFIRHYLITRQGHLREVDVFKKLQSTVRGATGVLDFATSLDALAAVYVATFNPDHERWAPFGERARRAIEVLHLFDVKPMRPVVMAVANTFAKGELVPTLEYLSILGVRLVATGSTRTAVVEVPLAAAARKITEGGITSAAHLRSELAGVVPSDSTLRDAFKTLTVSNTRLAKYYLRSLQTTADRSDERAWWMPNMAGMSLEHVLPQRPEGNWPQFTDEQHGDFVNRLGNLALMKATDNSDLRSDPFESKRPTYAKAYFTLTSQIADLDAWTPEAIEQRQATLASFSADAWPIKPAIKPPRPPKATRSGRETEDEDINEIAHRTMREATDS
jgi:Protein of unknown function DUF262/Protein of unknown function (DUF1524)